MSEDYLNEWNVLSEEYKTLEESNARYLKQLGEITALQHVCLKGVAHQRYGITSLQNILKNLDETDEKIEELRNAMRKREAELESIEQTLPKKTGVYLRLVLGNIDISFLDKEEMFRYKDDYEKFKLIIHVAAFIAVCLLYYYPHRPLELLYISFLIWYYCTITVRESILKANGSRIKGWWRLHHVISTVVSAILLIWPDNEVWWQFRKQFVWYNIYTCFITYLQFKYQRSVLYKLKALGVRHNMDITVEGFPSWMWRELAFLLPFLFVGYIFQLVNSIVLYQLSYHPQASWQVYITSLTFMVLFIGNFATTMMVVTNKIKPGTMFGYRHIIKGIITKKKL